MGENNEESCGRHSLVHCSPADTHDEDDEDEDDDDGGVDDDVNYDDEEEEEEGMSPFYLRPFYLPSPLLTISR